MTHTRRQDEGASIRGGSAVGNLATPGKRTLTESLSEPIGNAPADIASRGVANAGGAPPHIDDRILQLFGRQDVPTMTAHQDPAAREATSALGAQAFEIGSGSATAAVQRKTDDAAPSPVQQRRMMELYLTGNQLNVWRTVGNHARSLVFPDPHPRLTWINDKAFVRELLMQLEANISDCVPLAKLDEILHPSNAARTIGAMMPSTDAWSPPLGLAIAQALQIAIVSSLHRLGPRYLAAADASGAVGDGVMNPSALIYSMPIDRYVGAAMCAPHVLTIEPPSAKVAAAAKSKTTGPRSVDLAWEGEHDTKLWNWVRATRPADATAEEVAAKLWAVTDHHGETNTAFKAYLLAAAPPLFGVPKRFALVHPHLKQLAPAGAFAGDDSVDAELAQVANCSATDDIALHQSPGTPTTAKHAAPPEVGAVLSALGDCHAQLTFVATEVASWGLAGLIAPGLAFVARKSHEVTTTDAKALADWNRVIGGQRDRLFAITGAIHTLASTAKQLGVKEPKAPEATPVREILELLATAAGTSHLAQTSDAKLLQARELQAGLNARAVQATERDLVGAHLEFAETMGPKGAHAAAGYSHEIGELQERSQRLQTTMINGGEVDISEIDEVTLHSGEIALRERVLGTVHSTFALQDAAASAKEGLAAHIAMLFSGKFRNLESLCQHIRDRVTPIQDELIATEQQIHAEEHDQVGTPAQKATHRATRRAVLAKAQAAFAQISADEDLQHFFREGAKIVENQQFRSACVKAAALIGIAVLAAATGGMATELAGGMLMESAGVATVAELSTVARAGIVTANIVADSAVNAVGQTAVQGGSLKQAFVDNLFMSFASTALFGTIARASAETARLEGRAAMTWAKANTFAQKAFIAGREVGAIGVHTVWGAAIGYIAQRVGGGHEPSPMEAREWMLQGASVAIGRGVHAAVGARMPGLERLAKRSEQVHRLVAEAHQLQQLASGVEQSKNAATAVELLDQRTRLLREEIEAIEHLVAKEGDEGGELGKMRADLEQQVHESRSQAMLETKFHLLGLEELVPGALWKGTDKQIEHAVAKASATGGKVASHDKHSKRWKLVLDGREVEIQEVEATTATRAPGDKPPPPTHGAEPPQEAHDASRGPYDTEHHARPPGKNQGEPYQNPIEAPNAPHEYLERRQLPKLKATPERAFTKIDKRLTKESSVAVGRKLKNLHEGHALIERLARGDASALAELGVEGTPHDYDTTGREWALVEGRDGMYIYAGRYKDVALPAGARIHAHTHPGPTPSTNAGADGRRVTDLPTPHEGKTYEELLGDDSSTIDAGLAPSIQDIHAISDGSAHAIYTRYVHRGDGRISNPGARDAAPRVVIHLTGTKVVRFNPRQHQYYYQVSVELKDTNGRRLWSGEMHGYWSAPTESGRIHVKKPEFLKRPLQAGWAEP